MNEGLLALEKELTWFHKKEYLVSPVVRETDDLFKLLRSKEAESLCDWIDVDSLPVYDINDVYECFNILAQSIYASVVMDYGPEVACFYGNVVAYLYVTKKLQLEAIPYIELMNACNSGLDIGKFIIQSTCEDAASEELVVCEKYMNGLLHPAYNLYDDYVTAMFGDRADSAWLAATSSFYLCAAIFESCATHKNVSDAKLAVYNSKYWKFLVGNSLLRTLSSDLNTYCSKVIDSAVKQFGSYDDLRQRIQQTTWYAADLAGRVSKFDFIRDIPFASIRRCETADELIELLDRFSK